TAHVEIEAAAVAQEDVTAPPPRHNAPEQVARYLIRRQSPLPAEATGEAVLSLDPEYPPVHVPNLRSPRPAGLIAADRRTLLWGCAQRTAPAPGRPGGARLRPGGWRTAPGLRLAAALSRSGSGAVRPDQRGVRGGRHVRRGGGPRAAGHHRRPVPRAA